MSRPEYKIAFFGTPEFSVPALEILSFIPNMKTVAVFTQPDKPIGKKKIVTPPPIKIAAKKLKLPVFQPEKLNNQTFINQLQDLHLDVCLVVAYGKIIPDTALAIPRFGWLNIHPSLLPKYRGASPIQQAILDGKLQSGVTLMKLDKGLDTGPIIIQWSCTINSDETAATLHDKLSQHGAQLISDNLYNYFQGELKPIAQDNNQATITKIIDKQDGRIDWNKPADYIERQLRAYTPWPGTFCYWSPAANKPKYRLKIISFIVSEKKALLKPGQTYADVNHILVGTGRGNLEILSVQLEGKKPLPVNDFILGYQNLKQTQLE